FAPLHEAGRNAPPTSHQQKKAVTIAPISQNKNQYTPLSAPHCTGTHFFPFFLYIPEDMDERQARNFR
ncbi:hypothetical protein, partial [Alistipes putredinis]|uniref:hypothetical protein n=1 Tax=Alistipes putredinis TaxID=28117 RepID=UPI003AAD31BE